MSSVTVDVDADEGELERGGEDGNGKVLAGLDYCMSSAQFTTSLELNS